ncbi:ABC transporter permease [Peribacillus muralis]|uniref:ABC transporter permease n=1 Tax=Peribacillus muralis TaxID=264697 RepID=UPI003D078664
MRVIWNICRWEMQRIFKRPQSYLVMFAMPLLFTLLFGTLFGDGGQNKPIIALVDNDGTVLSKSLYKGVHEDNSLFTLEKRTHKQALQEIEKNKVAGIIFIPEGFEAELHEGRVPDIAFQHIPEFTTYPMVTGFLSNKLSKLKIESTAAVVWSEQTGAPWQDMYEKIAKNRNNEGVKIKKVIIEKGTSKERSEVSGNASGFSIMFLMITMVSVTSTILEAKSNGVWYRLMSTPASRFEIAAGYFLSFFLIGWIQFGSLIVATSFLFDVKWGNPLSLITLVSAMMLAIVGLGLMIAGFAKTVEQQSAAGNLIIISSCMIAGVYWPLEIEPAFMQKMADFLPQTWSMRGLKEIAANGTLPVDSLVILLAFAFVFLMVGMRKMKFE